MRIFVVVNRVEEIGHRQTTALLIAALLRRGGEVVVVNAEDVSVVVEFQNSTHSEHRQVLVRGVSIIERTDCQSLDVEAAVRANPVYETMSARLGDLILIRTNPGRDTDRQPVHETFLDVCRAAISMGIRVVNDPSHLQFFASKASLASIDPRYCPPMIVSSRPAEVVEFVRRAADDCVIKPLIGSRGQNVIRVSRDSENLESTIATTFGAGSLMAQHFVRADHLGDKRVVVVGGEILEVKGYPAGIERHPASSDFRANIHAGGTAHPLTLDDAARRTAEYSAKLLMDHGIWIAGVDLIGDKVIEFNVFSTGGLFDAEQHRGFSFADEIVNRLM